MKEGAPEDPSRRNFLIGAGAVIAAGAIARMDKKEETVEIPNSNEFHKDSPKRSIESLTKDEAIKEITINEGRILRLHEIAKGDSFSADDPRNASLEYFFSPYRDARTVPTQEDIQAEIERLAKRNSTLRDYRDRQSPPL